MSFSSPLRGQRDSYSSPFSFSLGQSSAVRPTPLNLIHQSVDALGRAMGTAAEYRLAHFDVPQISYSPNFRLFPPVLSPSILVDTHLLIPAMLTGG